MEKQVDITFIGGVIKKHIVWLLLVSILSAAALYLFAAFFVQRRYQSTTVMLINAQKTDDYQATASNISTSRALIDTYIVILQSDDFLREIGKTMTPEMTPAQVKAATSMKSMNNTENLQITITTNSPKLSYLLCQKFAEKAPDMLIETTQSGYVSVYDYPEEAETASYPSGSEFAFKGFALGFIIYAAAVFFSIYFDNSVKSGEEIKNRLGLPILGEVPAFEHSKSTGK